MKTYTYIIMLSGGKFEVEAFNLQKAIILAQAEAIQKGLTYDYIDYESK